MCPRNQEVRHGDDMMIEVFVLHSHLDSNCQHATFNTFVYFIVVKIASCKPWIQQ